MEIKPRKYHRFWEHGSILREEYLHLTELKTECGENFEGVKT
jgi:hypothetical protein